MDALLHRPLLKPAAPSSFPDSPLSRALRQPMMLGLFLPIQSGGWTASTLPRTTTWTFDYNAALARQAEDLGFDIVFGLAQWLPKGGYNEVQDGQAIDSFMTVGALAAITSRILLISTVVMSAMVVCINRLVWRPLYRLAESRYRLDA